MQSQQWQLWRQDDNGIKFLLSTFADVIEAQAELAKFEAIGHKQTYWVVQQLEVQADTPSHNQRSASTADLTTKG